MSGSVIQIRDVGKRFRADRRRKAHERLERLLMSPARLWKGTPELEFNWVLRNVSFDVAPGEIVSLVGRNGSGKSVLLKITSRVLKPNEGTVETRGNMASILDVGTGFHPDLTGRENVFLSGVILGMRRAEIAQKFDAIVAFAGVEKYLETPVKRYSSGMRMRLALGVCSQFLRDIVLLDEVLAVADEAFQARYIETVENLARQGCAILMVSHDAQSVMRLCSRAILIEGHTVAADGRPREVLDLYHSVLQQTTGA